MFLTLRMQRLLFLEDEAGVGKHALALSPDVVNDTLGSLLKYQQDDIARIRGSEAARIINEIKRGLQASTAG